MLEGVAYRLIERGLKASTAVKIASAVLVALFVLYSLLSAASWSVASRLLEGTSLLPSLVRESLTFASCVLAIWLSLYLLSPLLAKLFSRPPEGDELFLLEALGDVRRGARHKGRMGVRLLDVGFPNAFLVGNAFERVILVCRGLLSVLDKEEVRAVLAHELGHVTGLNRALSSVYLATICVAVANALPTSIVLADLLGLRGPAELSLLLGVFVTFVPAGVIALSVGRLREHLADMRSVEATNAHALVRALEKVEALRARGPASVRRLLSRPSSLVIALLGLVLRLVRVHPSTEDRIRVIERYCEELS